MSAMGLLDFVSKQRYEAGVILALAVENIASEPLPNCHAQVDIESNPRYPHASIFLVGRNQVGIVVSMVMVGMTHMATGLSLRIGGHSNRGNVSYAVRVGRPIERCSYQRC